MPLPNSAPTGTDAARRIRTGTFIGREKGVHGLEEFMERKAFGEVVA